jgi:hypothetical protein
MNVSEQKKIAASNTEKTNPDVLVFEDVTASILGIVYFVMLILVFAFDHNKKIPDFVVPMCQTLCMIFGIALGVVIRGMRSRVWSGEVVKEKMQKTIKILVFVALACLYNVAYHAGIYFPLFSFVFFLSVCVVN